MVEYKEERIQLPLVKDNPQLYQQLQEYEVECQLVPDHGLMSIRKQELDKAAIGPNGVEAIFFCKQCNNYQNIRIDYEVPERDSKLV